MTKPFCKHGLRRNARLLAATLLLAALAPVHAAESAKPESGGPAAVNREQVEQKLQSAQERLEQAAHEVAELSMSLNDAVGPQVRRITRTVLRRPMLGIGLDMRATGDGVRVASVSPGGGAEAAGIKANDVIVSLNGKALHHDAGQSAQRQLLAVARAAKAGEAMAVEYQRDGKLIKTQITPTMLRDSLPELDMHMDMDMDMDIPDLPELAGPGGGARVFRFQKRVGGGGGFGSAELVELSPTLGSYFGTEKGLLVVRAPRDVQYKLQDGDVILDIDGRVPGSVSHAVQILESYRAGETAKLHILRQKKRLELAVEVPAAGNRPSVWHDLPRPQESDAT
jgi:C-terminal processing protease CtpA/Prc